MNSKKKLRDVAGVLLLNKPEGLTANQALQQVKRLFQANKAGHTGSLDPLATGMLPICLGEATRFSQFFLEANKRYRVTAQLGAKTTTGDREGEIIAQKPVPSLDTTQIEQVLSRFRGQVTQIPSMYSALKYQGRPLYELARQGVTVERTPRDIHIYELKLLQHTADQLFLEVSCSKGTYIRTLVEDIGEAFGCGAYAIDLYRVSVGSYAENQMCSLEDLKQKAQEQGVLALDNYLVSISTGLQHWPELIISEVGLYYLRRGQPIISPKAASSGYMRLVDQRGQFVGIGHVLEDGRVAAQKLMKSPTAVTEKA